MFKMAEQLKNVYTLEYITNLANKIKVEYQDFDNKAFINSIFDNSWKSLELKARMRHIALNLNYYLTFSYEKQLEILKHVSKDFSSFEAMFFQDFVELFGLNDFKNSMKALEIFTIDSSSEFAIRAFILKYEEETMSQMKVWAKDENEHLRRLACEGCRPRLPWAIALTKFKKNPKQVLEIIEILKYDKSKYVQKSVANNLNDISKDNPNIVIDFVKNNLGFSKELNWICKHASRTLLKKADKQILSLFGYKRDNSLILENFIFDEIVKLEENLNFSFTLKSKKEQIGNIRIEYAIFYQKANGTLSKKVFMFSQNSINQKEKTFKKYHSFKTLTTRKYYKGLHKLAIIINGYEKIIKEFELR